MFFSSYLPCLLNLEDDILLETDSPLDKTVTPPLYPPKLCDLKTGGLSDLGWSVSLLSNDSTLGNLPGLLNRKDYIMSTYLN